MDKANRLLPCPKCNVEPFAPHAVDCPEMAENFRTQTFPSERDLAADTRAGQPPAQMRHARPLLVSHALRALEASESQTPHSPHTDFYRILADYIAQLEARGAANDNALPTESKTA